VIQLSDLTKAFGDRTLLDHVTWQIGDGGRVGLCGPNGAGKTTLLKMLAGLDEPDEGSIITPSTLTIGYLPQDGLSHTGRTVFEEASSAFQPLLELTLVVITSRYQLPALRIAHGKSTPLPRTISVRVNR
jgi:ATP-binding cassette subfamily F protein 3